ncbi:MAG: PD40 domain-containing protein [Solibacteraceae bacterium]|nr:PD40 domain-containing protein [Solibacteraceae bacterium]
MRYEGQNCMRIPAFSLLCAALLTLPAAEAQTRLLRFPDLHGDTVVFTYGGDLWTAPAKGGAATRLTAHPGQELFPRFSPDGKWIAFTGQYDGDEQVYVIPATGGAPKQLTFYPARGPLPARWGYDNQVYDWTPDGTAVLFRSLRDGVSTGDSRLYTVPVAGGLPKALPMPTAGAGDYSPDGKKLFYSPLFRDFRTWKRYQGGWAQDLFIFDLASNALTPIDNSKRTERDPMWIGDKLYFASDRSDTLNLYEFDPATKRSRALTKSTQWDVRWPAKGDRGRIVYEMNGELQILDVRSGRSESIRISVPTDGLATRPSLVNVGGQISNFDLSPKGERALFVARGEIFTAPIEKGVPRNLTRTSGAHEKFPDWSPDGRHIAYISDLSGEEELYIVPQDGSGPAVQLTTDGKEMRYRPLWSPDSKKIAFSDKEGRLFVVTVADKSKKLVADEKRGQLQDFTWAPDSRHLAFSLSGESPIRAIHIWSEADGQVRRVTDPMFPANNPAWDPEGKYLYYLSDREFHPLIGNNEFNFALTQSTQIYALALKKDAKHPFPPESDEVTITEEKKAEEKKPEPKKESVVEIDYEGIALRASRVPVAAGNYGGLVANKGHLLYSRGGDFFYGRQAGGRPALVIFSLKDRKETVLQDGHQGYAISHDGSKLLVRAQGQFQLLNAAPNGAQGKKTVSTANLQMERVPMQEWQQIFNEVWRRYRDFFYVKNMHGYDWEALRRQYAPWLEYLGHRTDLNYVIGEMISELNAGHAYIDGGDFAAPPRPQVALPGARFELDETAGRYRIAKIFSGHNEEALYRSPLTEVGVNVAPGDYVLAIDGEDLTAAINPYRLLRGKANRAVTLTVNSTAGAAGARQVTFQPVSSETDLIYLQNITRNREMVDRLSNGRLGYIHIPDMGGNGIREFNKWFYNQTRKEGMVVDVRGNGGGNVSRMLIERFRRQLLATGFSRTSDDLTTYPDALIHGHLVCLLSETSASDGDIFPAMFREAGLGPLIGKRSWGGVVGITNRGTLIDGGTVNVPEFGFASADGRWVIEGEGVAPDIEVENDPKSVIEGRDPQLERGVQEALKRIQANPKKLPARPADPDKSK